MVDVIFGLAVSTADKTATFGTSSPGWCATSMAMRTMSTLCSSV